MSFESTVAADIFSNVLLSGHMDSQLTVIIDVSLWLQKEDKDIRDDYTCMNICVKDYILHVLKEECVDNGKGRKISKSL